MLTKCMLTPLKLARLMEWNGRLGKPSALMAVDITNKEIGIALAYHRQRISQQQNADAQGPDDDEDVENHNSAAATSVTALPPIPYMSHDPYHPSYSFLTHHGPRDDVERSLDRFERSVEVADQLAQLAHIRQVKGILVRWPGDLASACDNNGDGGMTLARREMDEGQLVMPTTRINDRSRAGKSKSDGSMGYMRGRILYLLDKCCDGHGHNANRVPSDPLLQDSRPFALWDTSHNEQSWIVHQQQTRRHVADRPLIPKKEDKYGNSMTEMDAFGRAAIYGNEPPPPRHGQFYYSSKQKFAGYRVSPQFETGGSPAGVEESGTRSQPIRDNFVSPHDTHSKVREFQGSLGALHALHDFAKENLDGRIVLPLWVPQSASVLPATRKAQVNEKQNNASLKYRADVRQSSATLPDAGGKPPGANSDSEKSSDAHVSTTVPPATNTKTNGLATLVPMPKRRRRGRREAGAA